MRILVGEHIDAALHSLKTSRMRAALTTLGVVIGIASITTILILAHGISSAVSRQVADIGGNVAVVRPGFEEFTVKKALTSPFSGSQYSTSSLSEDDAEAIRKINSKNLVAPVMTLEGKLKAGDNSVSGRTVVATTSDFIKMSNISIKDGQFIDEVNSARVAVVGHDMALDLFGTDDPISQKFTLHKMDFTVVGVLKRQSNPVNYNNVDFDNSIIIGLDAGKALHRGRSQIQQINIKSESASDLTKTIAKAEKDMTDRHGEKDFTILSGEEMAQPTNKAFLTVAGVMTSIATISLVVGGIGIMNIMLVSVAERTREIGIRKSVGASNNHIINQFLIESLLIALLGGIIGYAIGFLLAFIISLELYFEIVFDLKIAFITILTAVLTGLVFGLYPAIRAARKDPIESLRSYR